MQDPGEPAGTGEDLSFDDTSQGGTSDPPFPIRSDGKKMKHHEMCKGRFFMEVSSVSYFTDDKTGHSCAAVLLSTQFRIMGKRLKTATVPLSVLRANVRFEEHYPAEKEYVKIGGRDKGGSLQIDFHPIVQQNEAGRVLREEHYTEKDHPSLISLSASKDISDDEHHLEWFYKGSNNLNDFPSPVKVLIIVTNATEFKQSLYDRPFLFELRLGWKIQVTVFGVVESITKPVDILMYRLQEHAGWSFKIKGPYKPEGADTAYESIRWPGNKQISPVGLKYAMSSYFNTMKDWKAEEGGTQPSKAEQSSSSVEPRSSGS